MVKAQTVYVQHDSQVVGIVYGNNKKTNVQKQKKWCDYRASRGANHLEVIPQDAQVEIPAM